MPSPCPRCLCNLPARPQHASTTSCQAGVHRERLGGQTDQGVDFPHPSPTTPLSIQDLLSASLAPTFSPGPSALRAVTRATSPRPQCQWDTYPQWALTTGPGKSVLPITTTTSASVFSTVAALWLHPLAFHMLNPLLSLKEIIFSSPIALSTSY